MAEMVNVEFTVSLDVNAEDLWSSTFGSGWEHGYAWVNCKFLDGASWEKPGLASLKYRDVNDEDNILETTISVKDLARGYSLALKNHFHHCGSPISLDDQDACSSDAILQFAVYGELVFG